MPNRIVREGIIGSKRIDALVRDGNWGAEVFYRRLLSVVDDFGRFDADPVLLKAALYPRQPDMVRDSDLERWLNSCELAGLVRLHESKGVRVLEALDFNQRVRAKTSKYPLPNDCRMTVTRQSSAGNSDPAPNTNTHMSCALDSVQGTEGGPGETIGGESARTSHVGQHVLHEIWKCYPKHRRGRPLGAYAAIQGALDLIAMREDISDPVEYLRGRVIAYAESDEGRSKWAAGAVKWLVEGGYEQSDSQWKRSDRVESPEERSLRLDRIIEASRKIG